MNAHVPLFDDTQVNLVRPEWHSAEHAVRSLKVAPSTWDPDTMTVEVIAATETPVARRDAQGAFAERLTMGNLDLECAIDLPVYDSHRGASSRDVIGIVQSLRVENDRLIATLRLSSADDAAPVVQRVAEGTVTGVSIGYTVTGWQENHLRPPQHEFCPPPCRRGLSRSEAAEYIGIGTTKFDGLVQDGRMPKPKRIDGRTVWDRVAIDRAFDQLDAPDQADANPWD